MSGNQLENDVITEHRNWLNQIRGTRIPEIKGAKPMEGLERIPLGALVVSDSLSDKDWKYIKQPLIPLIPAATDDEMSKKAVRELRMLRAEINSQDAFLALIKDELMGGQDQWALSIINPKELAFSQKQAYESMAVSYRIGNTLMGNSSRASLFAITGHQTI